jgi:hypothetical protein
MATSQGEQTREEASQRDRQLQDVGPRFQLRYPMLAIEVFHEPDYLDGRENCSSWANPTRECYDYLGVEPDLA